MQKQVQYCHNVLIFSQGPLKFSYAISFRDVFIQLRNSVGKTYFSIQSLAHFDSSGCHRDGSVTLVDTDVTVDGEGEVVDSVLARDQSDTAFAPHVVLESNGDVSSLCCLTS